MFIDGVNARIAKIGNRKREKEYQNNLSAAIIELLQSPELRIKLSSKARKMYESKYSIKQMRDGYKQLIEKL
jgi:glycosyltransferase involved in cell wall biosynthesis